MESNSYFIKFYCSDVNAIRNEYSFNSQIFQLKKEYPELSKKEAIMRQVKK